MWESVPHNLRLRCFTPLSHTCMHANKKVIHGSMTLADIILVLIFVKLLSPKPIT